VEAEDIRDLEHNALGVRPRSRGADSRIRMSTIMRWRSGLMVGVATDMVQSVDRVG